MGPKQKMKILKIVIFTFLIYIIVRLDILFLISSNIFGNNFLIENKDQMFEIKARALRKWEEKNVFFKNLAKREDDDITEEECGIPSLDYKIKSRKQSNSACKRIKPVAGSCRIAKELFSNIQSTDCSHQKHYSLCKVKGDVGNYHVKCDISICQTPVSVSNINSESGEYIWTEFSTLEDLKNYLNDMVSPSVTRKHFGFCFLKCLLKNSYKNGNTEDEESDLFESENVAHQLLVLPPDEKVEQMQNHKTEQLNYNVIFVDSVSRHHFFRSLPKTVHIFNQVNRNYLKFKNFAFNPVVLDFELLQGLRSRTFESLQVLFSGYINPKEKPFGILDMPPRPLNTQYLFKNLKNKDYRTLWLEDLCWQWEWGISKDLRIHNKSITYEETWKHLKKALHTAAIDSLDITYASCQILESHNVKDPFHYADDVCFLGRHHHEYNIEFLQYFQKIHQFYKKPYFSFLETNIGHDDTMWRIQQFDKSLADYLKFSMNLKNTLTLIFSDHGNTYGSFVEKSDESRVEMFHPFLFMIIPPSVQKIFGRRAVDALVMNQQRLISLQDLHEMLYSLSKVSMKSKIITYTSHTQGLNLLKEVPANRSCSDIPRVMPNLCICQDYENIMQNDSFYSVLTLFATSKLNSEIQKQFRVKHPNTTFGFGNCRRLIPSEFHNVRTSFGELKNVAVVKMDIYFKSERNSQADVYFVAMHINSTKGGIIELITYERVTPYSVYEGCKDKGVDIKLCICDTNSNDRIQSSDRQISVLGEVLKIDAELVYLDQSIRCLYLVIRENEYGVVMEAVNSCKKETYRVSVAFWKMNMISSNSNSTIETVLKNGDIKFIIAAIRKTRQKHSTWKYTTDFKLVP